MTEMSSGQLVTPSLQLVRQLGAGGMGTVWVARHLGLNSDVVVKFITGAHAKNAEVVSRFQREAAAAAEVRSPHVVQMIDHGLAQNGLPYIAMELLEGEDLAARVQRQRLMPASEVAGVVSSVAKALSRAHERRIVHRDIKPENIFLCETGEDEAFVKVLDFGIAKVTGVEQLGGTATGAMIGTPYYMSPEQILGSKEIDHRTDLWSLGVVAFFAMTGARPFDADTLGGLSIAICHGPIPRPSQQNPRLTPAIDAWFATACARTPAERFQSARAMGEALVAAVGGRGAARVLSKSTPPSRTGDDEIQAVLPAMCEPPANANPIPATNVAPRSVAATLASTTGSASMDRAPTGATVLAGVPKRSPVVAIGVAAVITALVGLGAFMATRGEPSPRSTPAISASKPGTPADEPVIAKATAVANSETSLPSAAPTASASASATARTTSKQDTATSARSSAATATPSVAPPTEPKKPTTPTAKPKSNDEILE